jgi:hypothetical protein
MFVDVDNILIYLEGMVHQGCRLYMPCSSCPSWLRRDSSITQGHSNVLHIQLPARYLRCSRQESHHVYSSTIPIHPVPIIIYPSASHWSQFGCNSTLDGKNEFNILQERPLGNIFNLYVPLSMLLQFPFTSYRLFTTNFSHFYEL